MQSKKQMLVTIIKLFLGKLTWEARENLLGGTLRQSQRDTKP